jgi:5-methyltetrahydropteroyltriglutamate--homocysteine methyltransferase
VTDSLPLLPTSVIGSHGKPGWWFASVDAHEAGDFGPGDLEEMFDDAVNTAIRDMEEAGIDVITDGVGRIETPPSGFGLVKDYEYLRARTTRRVKATCAGPLTFGSRIHPGKAYKGVVDVAERFAEVINHELKGLVAAGADWIQLDEPARGNVSGEEMARLFNLATDGVKAKLGFHICFGNRFGRSRFLRSYEPYFPGVLKARADEFVLEFAGREMAEVDLWQKYGDGRGLGAGVIDVKGFNQDTAEDVARRIRKVLQHCPVDKVTLNPDCGFGWSPRYMCNHKLASLVAGAKLVRSELTGKR